MIGTHTIRTERYCPIFLDDGPTIKLLFNRHIQKSLISLIPSYMLYHWWTKSKSNNLHLKDESISRKLHYLTKFFVFTYFLPDFVAPASVHFLEQHCYYITLESAPLHCVFNYNMCICQFKNTFRGGCGHGFSERMWS